MKELFEATKRTVSVNTYPGYPTRRLTLEDLSDPSSLTLPDGEWSTGVFTYPTDEEQTRLKELGYKLDDFGRPLHPWLHEMLADPDVGVVTGLGEYWHWGPNRTADPIVINTDPVPKIRLIQRRDTGDWALPGGFIDGDESGADAARRELGEEAGLVVTGEPLMIYSGVVADARTTAHAWAETTALLWRIEGTPEGSAGDDAQAARWFPITELPAHLHGSHAVLIEQAITRLETAGLSHAFSLPPSTESYTQAKGGHMAYHRVIARTADGSKYFMKSHDKHVFTDPEGEAHSRQYLRKEKLIYDHLAQHGFEHLPEDVNLMGDHTLTMRALTQEDGWQWRAPENDMDGYVRDVFAALDKLEQLPPPDDFLDNKGPVSEMFYQLGWQQHDLINGHTRIEKKFENWYPKLRDDFRQTAELLARKYDTLYVFATPAKEDNVLSHHDLRQSNVAWHPEFGARIVDWSWAGTGPKNADATMLLIDLHKSGHDVSQYMSRFNKHYAKLLIGFWLHHCQLPPREPDSAVRFQQALSAISAYSLLMKDW